MRRHGDMKTPSKAEKRADIGNVHTNQANYINFDPGKGNTSDEREVRQTGSYNQTQKVQLACQTHQHMSFSRWGDPAADPSISTSKYVSKYVADDVHRSLIY